MEGVKEQKPIPLHLSLKQWELVEVIAVTLGHLSRIQKKIEQGRYHSPTERVADCL
ncbi:MAG TPA: hypothetical protein VNM72_09380 [Blastocatellia bacterium]|nr:hypothetical protein [Blastocatellia bacterium]